MGLFCAVHGLVVLSCYVDEPLIGSQVPTRSQGKESGSLLLLLLFVFFFLGRKRRVVIE